jgi:uncharacterized protein (TIGR03437 family)
VFGGYLASAELYSPDLPLPAPALVSLSGDGRGQGAIFHEGTRHVASPDDPVAAGESVDIYATGLSARSVIPPRVAIGGRLAAVLGVSDVPGAAGVVLVRVRVPGGIAAGPAVGVRLTHIERPSNHVTMAVR